MSPQRFDEARSAAIRAILIETVESAPQRARRRHLRIAVAAVVAALLAALGGTGVAVALSGGTLFPSTAPAPVTVTSTPDPSVSTPSHSATSAHEPARQVVVTGDRIVPRDILTAPAAVHPWSLDLPQIGGSSPECWSETVIDVADGFALIQQNSAPDPQRADCNAEGYELALSLVDTSTGESRWVRQWSWNGSDDNTTIARLLGTSGRVLIWNAVSSDGTADGPAEVLDLATGASEGPVTVPPGVVVHELTSVPGSSGDVVFVARALDANGSESTSWSVRRADPRALGEARWAYSIVDADMASNFTLGNASSILEIMVQKSSGALVFDVLDVDSGAAMVAEGAERTYRYFDGVTLRYEAVNQWGNATRITGVDDAGNAFWSRASDSGFVDGGIAPGGSRPVPIGLNDSTDVVLVSADNHLELVDGLTGETKWTADSAACAVDPQSYQSGGAEFMLAPDGILLHSNGYGIDCGFDSVTGEPTDVTGRRDTAGLGISVGYQLKGGRGSGGWPAVPGVVEASGTATAFAAADGHELWTVPIASDERWSIAGGHLVGFSNGRVFGIGIG